MSELNPENKCADLVKNEDVKYPTIQEMFAMQLDLQRFLFKKKPETNIDYDNATFKEKVDWITKQFRNFDMEKAELLERLPWKEWKSYTPEQLSGFASEEVEIETKMEFVDMFHFFMNIGLLIGITGDEFAKLYYLKNKENFDRQNRGY